MLIIPLINPGTAKDNSGNNPDGTINGATITEGVSGKALSFNGIDENARLPITIHDDFSISYWIRTNQIAASTPPAGWSPPVQWWAGNGLVDAEVCGVVDDFGTALLGSKASFGIGNPDTTISSTKDINDNLWHQITVTRIRDSGDMKLYVDGILEATGKGNTNSLTSPSWIGIGNNACDVSLNRRWFNGAIDEVRIYNRALTDGEISSLAKNLINVEEINKYNQIKQQVIGPNYKGPLQIQRIVILQALGGFAAVDTVQVDSEGKIVKAWTQTGYLGGLAAKAEIGYAIRKSDKPPTAGFEVFIEPEANVGPVKAEGGLKVDIDERGISGGEISGGLAAGPVSVTGSTSTEGWIGVGNFGVGASILGDMRTEEPNEIDPNSIFDKIIFDIIYATYGPTQPIDPAKMVGTRSDLTQTPIP